MPLPDLDALRRETSAAAESGDATGYILAEHRWLRHLLDRIQAEARSPEPAARANLRATVADLRPFIDLHIRKEEDAFFPAIETLMTEAGQGSTVDMYGEHDAIHIRHDELMQALDTDGDVARAAANFRRSLTVHFDNEEELIFAEAPRWLTEEANRSILDKLRRLDCEGPVSE